MRSEHGKVYVHCAVRHPGVLIPTLLLILSSWQWNGVSPKTQLPVTWLQNAPGCTHRWEFSNTECSLRLTRRGSFHYLFHAQLNSAAPGCTSPRVAGSDLEVVSAHIDDPWSICSWRSFYKYLNPERSLGRKIH